ncbi:hypothetical protein G6O69_17550 [Pseudenhygromyxa sp. WMMC2535]|uniref:hypothetical protein n=1 Tax=Pseudenhygromyxa sp. WMMC2535 TaxID=2712867 RepID=UPI001554FC21|nr:hypothetical protein [Pseudenhygromyxa sp. WMMC2535]NVB39652.1 hypothetical protein [Pseudenhygromyxa sp. WMMC2535]
MDTIRHRTILAGLALAVALAPAACAEPSEDEGGLTDGTSDGTSSLDDEAGDGSSESTDTSEDGAESAGESSDSTTGSETDTDTQTETSEGESEGSGTGLDPELILFEEDFELASVDTMPEDWDSFVAWQVNAANTPGSDNFALVDATRPHAGAQSLHVVGGANPAMLTRPLPDGTTRIYVRAYVWLTGKLGQNPGNNHETLLGIRGTPGQASDEVRFGEIKGVIGTNEVPSDDISPTQEQWGLGPEISAGEWHCIEVAFVADDGPHRVEAWRDGESVHVVDDPSQWNNKVLGTDFLDGKFTEFILGWHSFSNYANEVWFDDVVVALERVGC